MQANWFWLMKKINIDFKSFVVWVKPMYDQVFEPSSVHSRQFQTLAPLIITPAQHKNVPSNYVNFLSLKYPLISKTTKPLIKSSKNWFLWGSIGEFRGVALSKYVEVFVFSVFHNIK